MKEAPSNLASTETPAITRDVSDMYVPENIDVTCCLEESAKICYVTYGICKVGMGLCEVASLILGGVSITEIKDSPGVAWGVGLASTIANGASIALTYTLFKMENKIRKLDRAVGKARKHTLESEV
jgi:hypothetical protein